MRQRNDPAAPKPSSVQPASTGTARAAGLRPSDAATSPRGRHGAVALGFLYAVGALAAYWLGGLLLSVGSVLILVVVALFLAVGLNPAVEFLVRKGLRRTWSVLVVISVVILALTLFVVALVPVISDQVSAIAANAPGWLDRLERNGQIQELDDRYQIIDKAKDFLTSGDWASGLFGGVVGIGLAVLGFLANAFIVIVLTLYFLSSLNHTKKALYQLTPASKRDRVIDLGEQILDSVGGYVAGAFVVAMFAGITSLVFLFVVGLGEYAVALAAVVTLLDVIPMIGATLGAVVVTAIGFATDVKIGIACLVFYVIYQQFENYVLYPRIMRRSVDVAPAATVVAVLIGGSLLGVLGALLAIPIAAAVQLVVEEVVAPRQDAL